MNSDERKIDNIIKNIRDNVYEYNLRAMFKNIDFLILEISDFVNLKEMTKDKINILNNILENINISIQNKDYQLVADILKFQLKNFVKNI